MAKDAKGHGSDPRGGAIAKAQAEANRSGKPMSVLNLNTVGQAMHVVRDYDPAHETGMYAHQFVAKVTPQLSDTQAASELGQGHPKSEPVPIHPGASGRGSFSVETPDAEQRDRNARADRMSVSNDPFAKSRANSIRKYGAD